jgi:hypothetical protein
MPVQKEQVHDDMQSTNTITIEHMLESADHLIERHRGETQSPQIQEKEAPLPEGWVLHSATYGFGRAKKGWNVELMDTRRPFQKGSLVNAHHNGSLVAALQKANDKIQSSGSAGRA